MDPITQQAVLATAGAAAGGPKVYVDDVFSTYLYEGNDSTNQIINGIDLAGEGGLVWIKSRDNAHSHSFYDSGQGDEHYMMPNSTAPSYDLSTYYSGYGLTSFNNNGFTLGANWNNENVNNASTVSWTFRKAPGFFDVVTYTGNGSNQTIPHSLGSIPGMIIVKRTDNTGDWFVYHRSMGMQAGRLNANDAFFNYVSPPTFPWNNTTPTSTVFSVGANATYKANTLNETYVAYIFAHDDAQFGTGGNESIIKCGSYTGNGASDGPTINVGFEPQWLMIKNTTTTGYDWAIFDNMRGIGTGASTALLSANLTGAEGATTHISLTPTGFKCNAQGYITNESGSTYVYMAIRRPNKPPTAGTEVYKAIIGSDANAMTTGFTVDMSWIAKHAAQYWSMSVIDRLRDHNILVSSDDLEESPQLTAGTTFDTNDGLNNRSWFANAATTNHFFKRAPGFFDMVAYTGTGGNNAVNHNLGVTPEFVIIKDRNRTTDNTRDWLCWHKDLTSTDPYIWLNQSSAEGPFGASWITPSSTALNLSSANYINVSSNKYITYLFATLSGISKVGGYTGTGNAINVDCGFAAGARFILIKRTNSTGDWYLWNHADGIVSGNDPYHLLNDANNTAQVTNTDYIDPLTSGFTVTSSAPAALNVSGGTYLFLAIA